MKYKMLGKTGLNVSVIGFGGIPIQRVEEEKAKAIVSRAMDLGINFFDTARGYTDSEAKLSLVLPKRRKEVIIATKSLARTREGMAADIVTSLKNLKVDYIDLYQVHNIRDEASLEQVLSPDGALAALREAKKEGLVRHIGITGHLKDFLVEALKTGEFETVMFPFNPIERNDVPSLIDFALKANIGLIAMKPLAGGAFQNTELALRFILQYPVSTVIPGMDEISQVESNARLGDSLLPLSAEEKSILDKEVKETGSIFCRRCEYCQPCRQGIDIPTVFLLDGYYTRYDLKEWATGRYRNMPVRADACLDCGECEEKCSYGLPRRRMLAEAAARMA
jgi:predicted aldo/keto reductase-like oxidoreductase